VVINLSRYLPKLVVVDFVTNVIAIIKNAIAKVSKELR